MKTEEEIKQKIETIKKESEFLKSVYGPDNKHSQTKNVIIDWLTWVLRK